MWGRAKGRSATIASIPSPTKGINDFDSIANMDPTFAIDMLNLFPKAKSCVVRNGYKEYMTGFATDVRTIMPYNALDGGNELFVADDTGIYDATPGGVAPVISTALTNGYGSYVNFSNVAGNWLIFVNGTDIGKIYDGTSWADMVTTAASTQNMNMVHVFKKRMWFVEENTMTAWYLPVDAVTGVLTPFFLGGVFTRGGFLTNIFTWSIDSGDGLDDIIVFQSSEGEIVGYQGPDPATAATFVICASYFVGAPLGQRTNDDLGGDVAMLTVNGVVPISKVVGGTQAIARDEDTLTKNISQTFNDFLIARAYSPNWEIMNIPDLGAMFINFPFTGGTTATQFVMNTLTGAWTKYDLPMVTMATYNNALFFSDTQSRLLFLDVNSHLDNVAIDGSSGIYIVSGGQTAYTYHGAPGVNKTYNMVRPLFRSTLRPALFTNVATDFAPNSIDGIPSPPGGPTYVNFWDTATWDVSMWFLPNAPTAADVWDTGIWDSTLWSPPIITQQEWIGVAGMGYSANLTIKMATSTATEWISTDWVFVQGASL